MKIKSKPVISIILLTFISIVLLISAICAKLEAKRYKDEYIRLFQAEWEYLYRMTDIIDSNFISIEDSDISDYSLYANQVCYNYSAKTTVNSFNLEVRHFLIFVYDMYFKILSNDKYDYEITKNNLGKMNSEFQSFCKKIINEKPDWILKEKSQKYINYTNEIKELGNKYEIILNAIVQEGNSKNSN